MDWKSLVRERLDRLGETELDADVVDEIAEHLAQRYDDIRADQPDEEAALRAVLAELRDGRALGAEIRHSRARRRSPAAPTAAPDVRKPRVLADLRNDVRYGCRLLVRTPGFTVAAVLMLALGIGGTTAIFSIVDAVLLKPLPYPAAERLVAVWETDRNSATIREPASVPDFLDLREQAAAFEAIGGMIAGELTLTPPHGQAMRVPGIQVTSDLLPMLGAHPRAGRLFAADEHGAADGDSIVVSVRLARRIFGSEAAAVGRTLHVDDRVRQVVGVLPDSADVGILQWLLAADYSRGFADRDVRSRVDIWAPLPLDPKRLPRETHPLLVLARLRPGVSLDGAQEELGAIMAALERAHPENTARGAHVEPFTQVVLGPVRPALGVLLLAVGLVLLTACVNVGNLLLVRGTGRLREVAVRTALGAAPARLTRQFVVENALLAGAAMALGLLIAYAILHGLAALAPADVPRLSTVGLDGRVLFVTVGLTLTVTLVFGLVPAMQMWQLDVQRSLRAETPGSGGAAGRGRTRGLLVTAEIALAVVLTVGAGLMMRSLWQLQQVDPGFRPAGVLKAEFQLPDSRYPKDFRKWPHFVEVHRFNAALLEEVMRLPGIEAAAIAANHPLDSGYTNSFVVPGREAEARDWPEIAVRVVSPGYFGTLRVPLVRGRWLQESDDRQAPAVLIVNEAAAARFFEGRDPLGQQIAFWGIARTIVGIAGNERIHGIARAAPPAVYVPLAQNPTLGPEVLLVRGPDARALTEPVRAAIARVDPALAVFGVEPLADTLAESQGQRRFLTHLLIAFAALALLLATIGIHAVLSYDVSQRRREIGIRLALGAVPASVSRLVVGRAVTLAAAGLAAGALGSVGLSRLLRGFLFEVAPADLITLAGVSIVLGLVALGASYLPARRAVRTDPLAMLREE